MEPNSGADPTDRERQAADADLAIAVATGDRKALAVIFDRYAPRLLAFCHSMLHSRADAEDCLQDVFVLIATRISGLREPDRLRSWLFAIARHECLRRIDRKSKEVLVDEIPDRAPVDRDTPAEAALDNELALLLRDAIAGLPDRDRMVLDLADRQGLATDEVAAALAMSPGSAYKLLTRARATARKSIGALLVARTGRANCADLRLLLDGWNGSMTPLLRKRVARHIEECRACQEQERRVASPAALLGAGTAFAMPIPIGLRSQILQTAQHAQLTSAPAQPWPGGWPPASAQLVPQRFGLRRNDNGSPGGVRRVGTPAVSIAAAVAAVLIIAAVVIFRRPTTDPEGMRAVVVGAASTSGVASGNLFGPLASSVGTRSAGTVPADSVPADSVPSDSAPKASLSLPVTPDKSAATRTKASPPTTETATATTPRASQTRTLTTNTPTPSRRTIATKIDTGPVITQMTVDCRGSGGTTSPVLTWATANSTGIALSVDNPGVVGSYGTYGPAGSIELPPNGCDPAQGRQTYTVYALGNDGSRVDRTILWDPPTPTSTSTAPTTGGTATTDTAPTKQPTPTDQPTPTTDKSTAQSAGTGPPIG